MSYVTIPTSFNQWKRDLRDARAAHAIDIGLAQLEKGQKVKSADAYRRHAIIFFFKSNLISNFIF